jgi:septal ring factor EnvC (AmiA/AmiB activator)
MYYNMMVEKEILEKRIKEYEEEIKKLKEQISSSKEEREKVQLKQLLMFLERGISTFKKVHGV